MQQQGQTQGQGQAGQQHSGMPVTTAFEFPGWRTERVISPVFGLIVRSMGFAKGFGAAWKSLAGGEVT